MPESEWPVREVDESRPHGEFTGFSFLMRVSVGLYPCTSFVGFLPTKLIFCLACTSFKMAAFPPSCLSLLPEMSKESCSLFLLLFRVYTHMLISHTLFGALLTVFVEGALTHAYGHMAGYDACVLGMMQAWARSKSLVCNCHHYWMALSAVHGMHE